MTVKVKQFSRLRFGDLVLLDGIEFWDLLDLPEITPQPDDLTHTITGFDRIDLLAHRFYKDSKLWWVIAVANDMEVLPTAFNVGDTIRIPAPRFVTQVLFKDASASRRA
jgi:nucleoid-associated protein YgaU